MALMVTVLAGSFWTLDVQGGPSNFKGKPPTATPPPGGGGPDGIVFMEQADTIVKADPDGGNQTVLTGFDANGGRHLASLAAHDGQAYFLHEEYDDPTPVYPDGHPIRDLYVYDESANRIALTALDSSMQSVGGFNWSYDAARSLEDGVALFTAREFDTGGNVTQAGIYQVQIAFDSNGAIVGPVSGSLSLVVPAVLVANGSRGLFPDVSYISANGAGTEVLYDRISDNALYRTAFPTSSTSHTSLGITGRDAEWSPTENLIAFGSGLDLYTATSSGGNVTRIVSGKARRGNKPGNSNGKALFSYDGEHLLFARWFDPPVGNPTEARRVTKTGSGDVKLDDALAPSGWIAP
jgi:hypothetical protein